MLDSVFQVLAAERHIEARAGLHVRGDHRLAAADRGPHRLAKHRVDSPAKGLRITCMRCAMWRKRSSCLRPSPASSCPRPSRVGVAPGRRLCY